MHMVCSAMLTDAFKDCDAGFPIKHRFITKLFNLRGCRQICLLDKLLNADGMAENDKNREENTGLWTEFNKYLTIMTSQSEQNRQRHWYSNQHLESRTANQSSL